MLSGETVSPTGLIFQYMEALSKRNRLKAFSKTNKTELITFLDKNGKSDVYTGGYIHGIYRYQEMIGAPTTLSTSGQ